MPDAVVVLVAPALRPAAVAAVDRLGLEAWPADDLYDAVAAVDAAAPVAAIIDLTVPRADVEALCTWVVTTGQPLRLIGVVEPLSCLADEGAWLHPSAGAAANACEVVLPAPPTAPDLGRALRGDVATPAARPVAHASAVLVDAGHEPAPLTAVHDADGPRRVLLAGVPPPPGPGADRSRSRSRLS